jgi:hypothetical protein
VLQKIKNDQSRFNEMVAKETVQPRPQQLQKEQPTNNLSKFSPLNPQQQQQQKKGTEQMPEFMNKLREQTKQLN